ncbi:long-chain fatty acid--CoA ligase [Carboxylicivirga sp. M1479]|uniref:AMP-dependent synthetase/ligase n=1 Tax=Carboxylicivirga sp. M1479 TaxID=2594476 RepID=UPI0011782D21|nr:long-chain fatty acid--CoA ligase [Carboxylicivirga sp. M1479]TRX70297.1 long-chain fatty acid--CoA ligase [Carboxylicivirga sp. M1479]
MENKHIAHMLRKQADKYTSRDVFRHKVGNDYKSISWSQFKAESEQLAKYILQLGLGKQANIGIYSQNRPHWTTSDLAILSTGSVVVPIYPTATFTQLEYIVIETEMQLLFIGDNEQLDNAKQALNNTSTLQHVITFDCKKVDDDRFSRYEDIIKNQEDAFSEELNNRLATVKTDDLATIIYTSGTTGEPKGAMLNHSHFMYAFKIHDKRLTLGEDDVSMAFLPLSHVFERTWTYYLLHSGGINVYNLNPKEVINELPKVKPTVMCVVPRFFEKTYDAISLTADQWPKAQKAVFNWAIKTGQKYIEYQKDGSSIPAGLKIKRNIANALVYKKIRQVFGGNIKYMPCAGSALNNFLLRFFHSIGLFICYGYGATETTATVSCMPDSNYDFDYTGDIMPNIEVKINDENMILVKGETVFSGYYKKPEETAEVLIDGWYYTGDQGSIPEPGKLHMTERIKDIIKTSTGKYISPQKIELQLSKSDLIEQLCVIGDNRKYLSALIVPSFDVLKKLAAKQGINYTSDADLAKHPAVHTLIQESIEILQTELPKHEHVIKISILPEAFSIDNTMLTNSLKVRRKQVNIAYKEIIEAMY